MFVSNMFNVCLQLLVCSPFLCLFVDYVGVFVYVVCVCVVCFVVFVVVVFACFLALYIQFIIFVVLHFICFVSLFICHVVLFHCLFSRVLF